MQETGGASGTAERSENEEKVPDVQPEMKGEITISCLHAEEFLNIAAEQFMKLYPDVKVTINSYKESSDESMVEDYRTYLNTKIMTGKAEDILFTSFLPITKYSVELRNIFSKRLTQVTFAALLLLSVPFGFSTNQNMYAFDGINNEGTGRTAVEIDKSVAEKYGGMLTDEKVQQMMADFKPTQDLHGMNAVYLYQNAMQSALFRNFSDLEGNWNGLSVSDVFGDEEIKIGYTYGWLKTSGFD